MKRYLGTGLIAMLTVLLFTNTATARQKGDSTYPLILSFYSIGTGVPGSEPLQNFISTYRWQNKLPVLHATKMGGLGREGEYIFLFSLTELTSKQKTKFVTALSKSLPTLKQKGEMGGIRLTQNEPFNKNRSRVNPETVNF